MFKRKCVVKYVDGFGIEHAAKVETESLFEAAIRGLQRLDSSFWTEEDVWDRMSITVGGLRRANNAHGADREIERWIKSKVRPAAWLSAMPARI
jgi:hypothetical protein